MVHSAQLSPWEDLCVDTVGLSADLENQMPIQEPAPCRLQDKFLFFVCTCCHKVENIYRWDDIFAPKMLQCISETS